MYIVLALEENIYEIFYNNYYRHRKTLLINNFREKKE